MTRVLQNRNYRKLLSAATVSNFGTMMHGLALAFVAVAALDATPADLALLTASSLVPNVLLGMFAASWIDRLPRRPILIWADWLRAAVVLWIPIAAFLGTLDFAQLYAVAMVLGFTSFVFQVAHQSLLPSLVEPEDLVEANGKLRAAEAVSEGVAFASAGWLVQLFGAPLALVADAVSYVVSALFLRGIRVDEDHMRPAGSGDEQEHLIDQIREGIRYVTRNRVLLPCVGGIALLNFAWRTTGPVYLLFVYEELGFAPAIVGMVAAVGAVASFAGAVAVEPITRRIGRGNAMILGLALFGASILVLPLAPDAGWVGLLVICLNQAGDGFEVLFDVNQSSLRQTITPSHLLGRVSGSVGLSVSIASLVGVAAGGALGETIGLRATIVIAGAAALTGALWLALSPVRRH